MSAVFRRTTISDPPKAASAQGVWVVDEAGRRYLDAAGGAIVVNVGHGRTEVVTAIAQQLASVGYVHPTAFITDMLERYAAELAPSLPMQDPRIYPVSGGSEAVETALKLARAFHLSRGEPDRHKIVAREASYHGNSRGALDVSGRASLRAPYEPWLGLTLRAAPVYEYRCPLRDHPVACGAAHAAALEELFEREDPATIAAFVAEPIGGATLAGAVPPDDYWPAIVDVCRSHGVLVIADEVMTGFGRTGTWFGVDHWAVQPDILVAGKGAASGYWPLGLCVASGRVFDSVSETGFVHGFTYSHHPAGAAAGRAVLALLAGENLVEASAVRGKQLLDALRLRMTHSPYVGDIRGSGLLVGIEFVNDRERREPFDRAVRFTEHLTATAKDLGLLLYPSTGCADGRDGDAVLLGPPFVISAEEVEMVADRTALALEQTVERLDL